VLFGTPTGLNAVIEVLELTVTLVEGLGPNFTAFTTQKSVPVIVTEVPPCHVPLVGEMLVTVGAAGDGVP
jgi:hypothetical protein